MPSSTTRRWLAAFALALLAAGAARADLIFMQDGFVLQGTLRRQSTGVFDPVTKEMIVMPKGFTLLDDGPRRVYFSPSQVRLVEQLPAPAEPRLVSRNLRYILNPRIMPPVLSVNEVGAWDLKKWERDFWFQSPDAPRVGVKQGLAQISPYYARVDAITKFSWSAAYLTREWPGDEVLKLLKSHPDFQPEAKDTPAVLVFRRMRLVDFLTQAGWLDLAERELDAVLKDHPDQKDRIKTAREMVAKIRARDDWEAIKNRFHAGQFAEVTRRLGKFDPRGAGDRVQADVRQMRERLANAKAQLAEAKKALEDYGQAATTSQGKSLASAVAVILKELHPATVDRLDAFLGQVREDARRKARGTQPALTTDGLLSLAVTGWLLGSPSAEAQPAVAINLWRTRQMVLEYLQEGGAGARRAILDRYLKATSPRVDLDEVAQLIDTLPPAEPGFIPPLAATQEIKTSAKRHAVRYLLRLPAEYTHARQYPVLFVLHNLGQAPESILRPFEKLADEHGYLLVAPKWERSLGDNYGYSEEEHDAVTESLRDLRRRYRVDSDRVFLFGWGESGKMAFDVGLAHPDLFAGVLPMAAGPAFYPRRYWRNAQYLPFYAVNGTRSPTSPALREQFDSWITRGYPALWVEYKGRGTEFYAGELPNLFDWMRHQKRAFPLRQLGTDGNRTPLGNEFCTMRPEDNRFYWLSTSGINARNQCTPERWSNLIEPAAMTARIDASTNEVFVKTSGLSQVSIWLGRGPKGQHMIDFDRPVTVRVGLRAMWANRKVTPSLEVLLEDLYARGDRKHLFLARIDLNLR